MLSPWKPRLWLTVLLGIVLQPFVFLYVNRPRLFWGYLPVTLVVAGIDWYFELALTLAFSLICPLHAVLIARLDNPDLTQALVAVRLERDEVQAMLRSALLDAPAEVAPLQSRLGALGDRERELRALEAQLEVRAPLDGEWVAPALHEREGAWIERGQPLGELVDTARFRFSAVLPQTQAAELVQQADATGSLRLMHALGVELPVSKLRLVPYERRKLVSPALGFGGGGEVAVRTDDSSGTLTTEPFFELQAELADPTLAGLPGYQGLSGELRVPVPARPLWDRAEAALRQLLQRRYQL